MISTILTLIGALFSVAGKLFDWLYAQQMIDAGKTAQQVADLKAQVDAAHKALIAKASIDADIAANGERVPIDDPFLRD
jgi:hypothetical protein